MKQLTILQEAKIPQPSEIAAFEKLNGIKLPEEYVSFLLSQNPYVIKERVFEIGNREFWIHTFFPFDTTTDLPVQTVFNQLNFWFKGQYLAFANDAGGWQFVISINEHNYGSVHFCRMDETLPEALTFLAKDFSTFIDGLVFLYD